MADEDRVLNQPSTGADTKALEEADRKRDKSYQSLRLLVALYLNSADKQAEDLRKELAPLIRRFEEANGIAPNVLSFTGKTQGTGKKKAYELAYSTGDNRKFWVIRDAHTGALRIEA